MFARISRMIDVAHPIQLGILAGLGVVLLLGCSRAKVAPVSQKVDVTSGRSGETRYDRALRKQARKPPARRLSAREYVDQGNQYESQQKDDKAITAYTRAVTMDPRMGEARYRRAMIYQRKKLYAAAIMDLDQVLTLNPEFAEARYVRAIAYSRLGQHDQAIRDLSVVIERHSEYPRAYYERGRSYYATNDFDDALKDFDKDLSLNPDHQQGYVDRGVIYYRQGNYNQAVLDYTRALLHNPRSVRAYINRCWALALLGRAEKAKEDCVRAVFLNSRSPHAYDALAFVFWQLGDKDKALIALTGAKSFDPSFMVPKERYQEFPILLAQSLLKAIGYDLGTVDGEMGKLTRSAIRKFQRAQKFAVTGKVSKKLLDRLRKTPAARYLYETRTPKR